MSHEKNRTVLVASIISVIIGLLLIVHLTTDYKFDGIAITLLSISLAPWLLSFAHNIELPGGWKIQLREIEKRLDATLRSERYSERGYVYLLYPDKRNIALAIHFLERAVALDSKNVLARGRYASALRQQGKLELALREVTKAIQTDDGDETLYYNRACYKSLLKRDEQDIFIDLEEAVCRFQGLNALAENDDDLAFVRTTYPMRFSRLLRTESPSSTNTV